MENKITTTTTTTTTTITTTTPVMPLQVPYSKIITSVYQQCAVGFRKLNKLPFRWSRFR